MRAQILRSLCCAGLLGSLLGATTASAQSSRIFLYGVNGEAAANIRALIDIDRYDCDVPRWRLQRALRRAPETVSRALRAVGHYEARVTGSRLTFQDNCWQAHFDIDPGPPVLVERMDVEINGDAGSEARFKELLANLPLKRGDQLHHGRYETSKSNILNLGTELGYFDGEMSRAQMQVNPTERWARIGLTYDSGERYNFGEVTVTQDVLDPAFVDRYINVRAGDPYDGQELSRLYQGLSDSGYFREVQVRPEVDRSGNRVVPINLNLIAMPRRTHSFGIGADTDTGPRMRYSYADRRINRIGHRLEASIEVSAVGSEFGSEYRIPADDPRNEWFSINAARKSETTETAETSQLVTGIRRTRKLDVWLETASLEAQRETFTVAEVTDTTSLLIPGISWTRSRADAPTYPRSGYRIGMELRGASTSVLSDVSFLQGRLTGKRIWSLPFDARLLVRVELGGTELEEIDELPASLRFFAGGDNSVRGYAYQSLGPADASGDIVGGRYLVVGSAEVDWPFAEKWSIAGFVDEGNAINKLDDDLLTGVGFGLRWRSPMGPIRLDFAHPFDDPDTDVRFHLSMGLDL